MKRKIMFVVMVWMALFGVVHAQDLKDEEQYLSDYEDKWYDKFAAMEKAMEKVNSKSNALAGLFGTGR